MFCDLLLYQYDWFNNEEDDFYNFKHKFFCQGDVLGIQFTNNILKLLNCDYTIDLDETSDFCSYYLFSALNNQNFFNFTFLFLPKENSTNYSLSTNFYDIFCLHDYNNNLYLYFSGQFYFQKSFYTKGNILIFKDVYFFQRKHLDEFIRKYSSINSINRIYNF